MLTDLQINKVTYAFKSSIITLLENGRWMILFLLGALPILCLAHDSLDSISSISSPDIKITTQGNTKIFIVEGTVTSNLTNNDSIAIVSIPSKEKIQKKPWANDKEKRVEEAVVRKRKTKRLNGKSIASSPSPEQKLLNLRQEAKAFITTNRYNKPKKTFEVTYLHCPQNLVDSVLDFIFKRYTEIFDSYLSTSKIVTRPPPYFMS